MFGAAGNVLGCLCRDLSPVKQQRFLAVLINEPYYQLALALMDLMLALLTFNRTNSKSLGYHYWKDAMEIGLPFKMHI